MPDLKKVEYMIGKEGSVYDVDQRRYFFRVCRIDNTVEGLVHVTSLEDDLPFDEKIRTGRGARRKDVSLG